MGQHPGYLNTLNIRYSFVVTDDSLVVLRASRGGLKQRGWSGNLPLEARTRSKQAAHNGRHGKF